MHWNSATPSRRGLLGALGAAALVLGCSDVFTPRRTTPLSNATMSVSASVAAQSATQILFIAFYSSGPVEEPPISEGTAPTGLLGMSLADLDANESQSFPLSLDLSPCLTSAADSGSAPAGTCPFVYVEALLLTGHHTLDPNDPSGLEFLSNSILDGDVVGPFAVARGATVTAPRQLVLHEVATIDVDPLSLSLEVGQSAALTAILHDIHGQEITGKPVTWQSDDPSVAQVDPDGRVTARAPGFTAIQAAAGGRSTAVFVEVVQPSLQIGPGHSADFLVDRDSTGGNPSPSSIAFTITSTAAGGSVSLAAPQVGYGPNASGWLDVALSGVTTPATMTLKVGNAANVPPGVYEATVTVRSTDPSIAPDTLLATLTVQSFASFDIRARPAGTLQALMGKR